MTTGRPDELDTAGAEGRMTRRKALSATALAALAVSAHRVLGANNRIRLGWIGCGARATALYDNLSRIDGVEVVAACDVYAPQARRFQRWIGSSCEVHSDFRRVLDRSDVDAVVIATPDHWHAIPTVLACSSGKDVYVEKPLGHNVREGRAMVDAARRHRRVVQTGTQQRSAPHFGEIRDLLRRRALGEVRLVRIWTSLNLYPEGIGTAPDQAPPEGLDWDFYLGPAPQRSYNPKRFRNTFRYFWDYAGGSATDLGTHRFDILHHVMEVEAPRTVAAAGGRFALRDDGEVPDTLQATLEYPGFVLSYESSLLNGFGPGSRTPGRRYYRARGPSDCPFGMAFHGTNGTLFADRLGYEIFPELQPGRVAAGTAEDAPALYRMAPRSGASGEAEEAHLRNFLDCIRSRELPVADVAFGHQSSNVAHLINIAFRTGRKLQWDAATESFVGAPEVDRWLARQARKPWDLI